MSQVAAQAIVNGVLLGGLYAAVALGFVLIWRINRVVNLAHGEFVMLGAYLTWALSAARLLDPLATVVLVVPVMFVLGYGTERLVLSHLTHRREIASLLVTLGLSVVLQQGARILFTPTPHVVPLPLDGLWRIGPANIAVGHAVLLAASLGVLAAVAVLLRWTPLGRSLRAVAQDAASATLIGIDVPRVRSLSFALGAAVAGVAGVLVSQAQPIHPTMGPGLILSSFVVAALAGGRGLPALLASGMALGVLESVIGAFVPRIGTNFGVIAAGLILVVVLIVRRESPVTSGQRVLVR